jgi:hypothetical protein
MVCMNLGFAIQTLKLPTVGQKRVFRFPFLGLISWLVPEAESLLSYPARCALPSEEVEVAMGSFPCHLVT